MMLAVDTSTAFFTGHMVTSIETRPIQTRIGALRSKPLSLKTTHRALIGSMEMTGSSSTAAALPAARVIVSN